MHCMIQYSYVHTLYDTVFIHTCTVGYSIHTYIHCMIQYSYVHTLYGYSIHTYIHCMIAYSLQTHVIHMNSVPLQNLIMARLLTVESWSWRTTPFSKPHHIHFEEGQTFCRLHMHSPIPIHALLSAQTALHMQQLQE